MEDSKTSGTADETLSAAPSAMPPRGNALARFVVSFLAAYFTVLALMHSRVQNAVVVFLIGMYCYFLMGPRARHLRRGGLALAIIVAIFVGLGSVRLIVGSRTRIADAVAVVTAAMITIVVVVGWRRLTRTHHRQQSLAKRMLGGIVFLVLAWVGLSIADRTFASGPLPRDPTRFQSLPVKSQLREAHVGLALSGGGYRAALFHAGVLAWMEEHEVPITHISSVSGGSIIGSYYAAGGPPREFLRAVQERQFMLVRELFNVQNAVPIFVTTKVPILGTSVLPGLVRPANRLSVQADLIDRLLLDGQLVMGPPLAPRAPELLVCATELDRAEIVGVCRAGIVADGVVPSSGRFQFINAGGGREARVSFRPHRWDRVAAGRRLADFVAASGAFPGAFPPLAITRRSLWQDDAPNAIEGHLADGGITDNLGLRLLLNAHRCASSSPPGTPEPSRRRESPDTADESPSASWKEDAMEDLLVGTSRGERQVLLPGWRLNMAIVSDGGALFTYNQGTSGGMASFGRTIDVIYANGGEVSAQPNDPPVILISPWQLVSQLTTDVLRDPAQIQARALKSWDQVGNPARLGSEARTLLGEVDAEWQNRLEGDVAYCLSVFVRTSTLDDHPPKEDAAALFRLGQYCAAWNADAIWRASFQHLQLREVLQHNSPTFDTTLALLDRSGLLQEVETERATVVAPTEGSWEELDDDVRRSLLERAATEPVRALLRRHLVDGWLPFASLHTQLMGLRLARDGPPSESVLTRAGAEAILTIDDRHEAGNNVRPPEMILEVGKSRVRLPEFALVAKNVIVLQACEGLLFTPEEAAAAISAPSPSP